MEDGIWSVCLRYSKPVIKCFFMGLPYIRGKTTVRVWTSSKNHSNPGRVGCVWLLVLQGGITGEETKSGVFEKQNWMRMGPNLLLCYCRGKGRAIACPERGFPHVPTGRSWGEGPHDSKFGAVTIQFFFLVFFLSHPRWPEAVKHMVCFFFLSNNLRHVCFLPSF